MPYMSEIQEEIDSAIEYHAANMPDDIKALIGKAKHDLYSGPSYYNADGDDCSPFDDGAVSFSFDAACDKIRDYLSEIDDITTFEYDPEDDSEISVRIDGTADRIRIALVGRELYSYVR